MAAKKQKTFESALQGLEKIVQELESGDLSLEQSLEKFEEGMKLSRFCTEKLTETERRISILTRETDGLFTEKSFPVDEDDELA
jgi:exodeoxyribonuclease VII small subunit